MTKQVKDAASAVCVAHKRARTQRCAGHRASEDEIYDLLGRPVGNAEIYPGDGHKADDDGRGLCDMTPVGPLYSLQLSPAGPKEGKRTPVDRLRGLVSDRRLLGGRAIAEGVLGGLRTASAAPPASSPARWHELSRRRLERAIAVLRLSFLLDWDSASAADERSVELVDVPCVGQGARDIGSHRAVRGWRRRALTYGPLPALPCALAITGHSSAPALASLPVAGVPTAPATVLAQAHPIGVVALGLVCLIVAMLALLAGEGDSDPNVSASHSYPCVVVDSGARSVPRRELGSLARPDLRRSRKRPR